MATEKATGRDSDKIMLRVPDGMRDQIFEAARANNRTMNAEIVARLIESFEARETGLRPLTDAVEALQQEMQVQRQLVERLVNDGYEVKVKEDGTVHSQKVIGTEEVEQDGKQALRTTTLTQINYPLRKRGSKG